MGGFGCEVGVEVEEGGVEYPVSSWPILLTMDRAVDTLNIMTYIFKIIHDCIHVFLSNILENRAHNNSNIFWQMLQKI